MRYFTEGGFDAEVFFQGQHGWSLCISFGLPKDCDLVINGVAYQGYQRYVLDATTNTITEPGTYDGAGLAMYRQDRFETGKKDVSHAARKKACKTLRKETEDWMKTQAFKDCSDAALELWARNTLHEQDRTITKARATIKEALDVHTNALTILSALLLAKGMTHDEMSEQTKGFTQTWANTINP